jgi:hypothetical protein
VSRGNRAGGDIGAPTRGSGVGGEIALHYRDRRRALVVVGTLVAVGLLAFALGGPWWQMDLLSSTTGGGSSQQVQSAQAQYALDGSIHCSVVGWGGPMSTPCSGLSSTASGVPAILDAVAYSVVWGLIGLGIVAAGLLGLGVLGVVFGRWQLRIATLLLFVVAIAALTIPVAAVAVGPGAQAQSYCSSWSEGYVTCSFFWGGSTVGAFPGGCGACADVLNWGAGLAWYGTVAAGGLALFGAYVLWIGRKGPFTKAEEAAWAKSRGYMERPGSGLTPQFPSALARPAPAAPPGPSPVVPPVRMDPARRAPWKCPRCGTVNGPWNGICGRCREARPDG